jgi:hypothetical protein
MAANRARRKYESRSRQPGRGYFSLVHIRLGAKCSVSIKVALKENPVVDMAMRQLVRQLWTGVAAATVAGLLSAVITRLLMRAVAHVVNGIPQFSLGGSAFIALVYIVCLLPGCLALACTRARWPWLLFLGGSAFLIFEAVAIGLGETSAAHDMTAGRWLLLVVVLTAMAATYATQFVVAARWARRNPATAAIAVG